MIPGCPTPSHSAAQCRAPVLKRSSNPSLRGARLQAHATTPGMWRESLNFGKISLAKFRLLRTTKTEFCGIEDRAEYNNFEWSENRAEALVMLRAVHVAPGVVPIDMYFGRGLALQLVAFLLTTSC